MHASFRFYALREVNLTEARRAEEAAVTAAAMAEANFEAELRVAADAQREAAV